MRCTMELMFPAVTMFLIVSLSIFILPNRVFAWFEYYSSLVKIILFIITIIRSLAIVCGTSAAPPADCPCYMPARPRPGKHSKQGRRAASMNHEPIGRSTMGTRPNKATLLCLLWLLCDRARRAHRTHDLYILI